MATLTPAQQRMIDRARSFQIAHSRTPEFLHPECKSQNRLIQLGQKYGWKLVGMTTLRGSADFRVAYALQDKGFGKLSSCPISDRTFFIIKEHTA